MAYFLIISNTFDMTLNKNINLSKTQSSTQDFVADLSVKWVPYKKKFWKRKDKRAT